VSELYLNYIAFSL